MLININLDTLLFQEVNLSSFYYHIATFYSHLGFKKDIFTEVFKLAFAVTTEVLPARTIHSRNLEKAGYGAGADKAPDMPSESPVSAAVKWKDSLPLVYARFVCSK